VVIELVPRVSGADAQDGFDDAGIVLATVAGQTRWIGSYEVNTARGSTIGWKTIGKELLFVHSYNAGSQDFGGYSAALYSWQEAGPRRPFPPGWIRS
jgi:hypothetical protein